MDNHNMKSGNTVIYLSKCHLNQTTFDNNMTVNIVVILI